jgi:N-acyl-D-amino-acid deacylase
MRFAALLFSTSLLAQTPAVYDVVISNGRIVDGTGNAWFRGDIGIRGDRIAKIAAPGQLALAITKLRLDASRMVVAPGFIDIQGQSRGPLLNGDGRLISKLTQGITTEIMGEGSTNAPANGLTLAADTDEASRKQNARFATPHGFRDWLEAMQQHGASPNFGSFVGATTLRMFGKGMAQGEPTPAELEQMTGAMKRAMEDGAFGLSSALIYPPGEYTTTRELIELAKAMSPYGGVYITHMRSEADRLLEAIDEAIEIGRKGNVPVEIYHLKAAGQANWPKMPQAIAKIDDARRSGVDVGADMYPYLAGGTGLTVCLPPWVSADGKLFDNLKDSALRTRIHAEMIAPARDWENLCQQATPEGVLITQTRTENQQYQGKRLADIATIMHKDWADAAIDLIASEHRRVETIFFVISEDNLKLQLRQPWIKFGTDAAGIDPATARGLAHPRAYGNFARVLGKYVREEHVIPLEDAIRKMTSAVANRLSIPDRGLIKEGMFADIVIFDPETVADNATYEKPHQLSTGIRDVFVNGVAVVREGQHTGAKPGRIVWGPGHKP